MVTNESVSLACSEVSRYSEEQMAAEFERFFRRQPAVCEFVSELTSSSGQQIQEMSLFLSYMIFKTMETCGASNTDQVSPQSIEVAFREAESWIDRISRTQTQGAELQSAIASSLNVETEPCLLQYVISELNEPADDGTELADEEKGEIFFVLKTVISSFSRNSLEQT